MEKINEMRIDFTAKSETKHFARIAPGAFLLPLNPTTGKRVEDIRTAVSEAVTERHCAWLSRGRGNGSSCSGKSSLRTVPFGWKLWIAALALPTLQRRREPLYTSCPEMERSGMGFTVMETFMDTVEVYSTPGHGTTVKMIKQLAAEEDAGNA